MNGQATVHTFTGRNRFGVSEGKIEVREALALTKTLPLLMSTKEIGENVYFTLRAELHKLRRAF